ncbi:hypothetical protein TYRP_003680 [Tyrophagus putrescentiae]|nr:hypothetical protein TYRP_003680 [Tyrophagus putrescentiae]
MKLFAFFVASVTLIALVQAGPFGDSGDRIGSFFGDLRDRLQSRIEEAMKGVASRMSDLTKDLGDIRRSIDQVRHCYRAQMTDDDGDQGEEFNLFNGDLSTKEVVEKYYSKFSFKNVTPESVSQLMNSVRDIITHCLNNSTTNGNRNSTVQKGFTSLSDSSDEEILAMTGHVPPSEEDLEEDDGENGLTRRRRSSGSDSQCQVDSGRSLPRSFDWRDQDKVTSVKNQGSCGSCWTFASMGAMESAILIKNNQKASSNNIDLSEQLLVNCGKQQAGYRSGGCQGGNSQIAFSFVQKDFTTSESVRPYQAKDETCEMNSVRSDRRSISDYCVRSKFRYSYSSRAEQLSDDTMMRALVQKGPLYIAINANPLQYRNLRSGVLNEPGCSTQTNHAVLLVGYDGSDNSWIIKNSWGPYWGDRGYFKMARGSNMCGVNTEIAWPIL